jgi:hypothetical protein
MARLLNVIETRQYLGGISDATIRRLVARGELKPTRLPSVRHKGETGRRLLFDVQDLDAVVDRWKSESTSAPNEGLSRAALKGWTSTPVRKRA